MKKEKTSCAWACLSMLILMLTATTSWGACNLNGSGLTQYGTGSSAYYAIASEENLRTLADYVNSGNDCEGVSFKVTANIKTSSNKGFIPIGKMGKPFNGSFSGKGSTISIYNFDASEIVTSSSKTYFDRGLFGVLGESAHVIGVTVSFVSPSFSVSANYLRFGGIAGYNRGLIETSKVVPFNGPIKVDFSKSTQTGTDRYISIGGLVGENSGTIQSSSLNAYLEANAGTSGSLRFVGGIVGVNTGSKGNIDRSVPDDYYTVTSQNASCTGGVAGQNEATITNCDMESDVLASSGNSGGITGKNYGTITYSYVASCKLNGGSVSTGAIAGAKNNDGTAPVFKYNYYHDVSINGTKKISGVGVGGVGDVSTTSGAIPLFEITKSDNVKIKTSSTMDGYYASGVTVSLDYTGTVSSGNTVKYTVTDSDNKNITVTYSGNTGTFTMPGKNVTVSAKTEAATYTITYNLNGGTNPSGAPTTYTSSKGATLPNPTRTGYSFDGWYTNSSFTGTKYTSIAGGSTGNKTFYAKWNLTTYTITYNLNGGTNPSTAPTTYTYTTSTFNLPAPTKTGYVFAGWYTSSTFSGVKETTIAKGSAGNRIYYAKWNVNIATNSNVTVNEIADQPWTGSAIKPTVTVKDGTTDITSNMNVNYSNNTEIGKATITISAKSGTNYEGTKTITFQIVKATPTITAPQAKTLKYNGEAQNLVTAGSTTSGQGALLYSLDGDIYSAEIPTATNAGVYTVYYKSEEDEHYNSYEDFVIATIPGTYIKNGALDINEIDSLRYVTIDGNNTESTPLEITEDFDAKKVKLTREFPISEGFSTLVLPFEVDSRDISGVDSILEFVKVGVNKNNVKQVEMKVLWSKDKTPTTIKANRPYLVKMSEPQLEIHNGVKFKKTEAPIEKSNDWTFVGVYSYKEWDETSDELGRAYGFAGQSNEDVSAGEFIKIAAGAYIHPMRAYLLAPAQKRNAPRANGAEYSNVASIDASLPDYMNVVVVDSNEDGDEHTTVIGTFNTRTGKFEMKRDYDLKGRNLQGKPKARGAYYGKIKSK